MSFPSNPSSDDPPVSSSGDLLALPEHRFDMSQLSALELRSALRSVALADSDEKLTRVDVYGAAGQDHALMGIRHPVQIKLDGPLGDYALAMNHETIVRTEGDVGIGVGEGMTGGAIRIRGNAGNAAGTAISGGTLAIYGNAGDRLGAAMRGGGIFVRGDVGNDCGYAAVAGTIVIGGDAGEMLGHGMNQVTIFIRGQAKSLAPHMVETPLRKREHLRLGLLLINASIRGDSKDFRRVVSQSVLDAEQANRGEINPSWR